MAHITRKQLKKDQIRDTLVHGAEAVASHKKQVWIYGAVALGILAAVLGWRFYSQRQTALAAAELAEAMKIYDARIREANEPLFTPDEITYVDERNKYGDAAARLTEVADNYSRTRPGQVARYYAALSLVRIERYDDAERALTEIESGNDQGLAALARYQLAQVYEKTDRGAQAIELYQQLLDRPHSFVPKPMVLLAMAAHYSQSDPAQAARYYTQVKDEYPDSLAAEEADRQLQMLPSAATATAG